jgi:3-methyladenine DNA glycosylase AlkD
MKIIAQDHDAEYQKRAGFVCMVSYAFTHKHATDEEIRQFFPIMIRYANDERKYVMKGINWALRQVGKRNQTLYEEAIKVAHEILGIGSKSALWIAKDALRQLIDPKVYFKNYPISSSF